MRYKILTAVCGLAMVLGACEKEFLQIPVSDTTTVDSVFSTTIKAQSAIAEAYFTNLSQGLPYQGTWNSMIQANLSGELNYGFSWTMSNSLLTGSGMTATGRGEDIAGYDYNYTALRKAWIVKENIDQVSDMSDADKAIVKAEMTALAAYRYEQMMIMYGGVPIVSHSFNANDSLAVPRAPLQEVLDTIVSWCDQAADVLPSKWSATWTGRMTKSAALAIKSKALLYAARPLFNSATPYLSLSENNNLICFGSHDDSRWTTAAAAADAEIAEAEGNGGFYIINTGNPLADYGTATSTPANAETILSFKTENYGINLFYDTHNWQAYGNMLVSNFMEQYYTEDGTDQTWPEIGDTEPFSEYLTKMEEMEPRFKASFKAWELDAWNNPNDNYWSNQTLWQWKSNANALVTKFYYNAGTRGWFEFPIFRLAAAYLSAAEAYNEMGETTTALQRLNVIHERAGLPAVTETSQSALRTIIQREWAVEFFDENYRLHDVKHWKLSNIGNGIIGGSVRVLSFDDGDGADLSDNESYTTIVGYTAYWAPRQYLNPFPQTEINKGILVQNPGY